MSTTLLNKDLGSRRLSLLVDMRKPLSLPDLAIEGRPHVEGREMSFAAESVASEDRGEDRSSIDRLHTCL